MYPLSGRNKHGPLLYCSLGVFYSKMSPSYIHMSQHCTTALPPRSSNQGGEAPTALHYTVAAWFSNQGGETLPFT